MMKKKKKTRAMGRTTINNQSFFSLLDIGNKQKKMVSRLKQKHTQKGIFSFSLSLTHKHSRMGSNKCRGGRVGGSTLATFLGRQMVAHRTLGGLGGIVQTAPAFKDQAGRVKGGVCVCGGGVSPPHSSSSHSATPPDSSYVAELHKQTATAASCPPNPHTYPLPQDPCPLKFSLSASTVNRVKSLRSRSL